MMKKTMASVILLFLLFLCLSSASGQIWLGGKCTCEDHPGACEIVSVLKTEGSAHQAEVGGGPGYEGYEVSFVFIPDGPMNLTENWEKLVFGREHLLRLCNSWYPGPMFLEKYNITEGAVFDCNLRLISVGTCTPIIFEFDEIDQCDYFESSGRSEEREGDGEEGEAEWEEGPASETVKIGAIYPLTGPSASSGEDMKRGILLAVEVINDQHDLDLPLARSEGIGSLNGSRVEVVFGDSGGDPAVGRSVAERLIGEEAVVALMGAYQSSVTAAASEVAEEEGIPFLTAASAAPSLTKRGFNWFFRTTPDEEIFVQNFYQFLTEVQKSRPSGDNETLRLAIVHEDSIWGEEFGDLARLYAEDGGFEIVADVSYSSEDPDVTDEVLRLRKADPDVVMQASYTEDAILYIQTPTGR
jgi:ABC-type branched-subunit amino acid transport system substrate-binding protein